MFAKFSVKKPLTIFVAVLMILILGFVAFTKMTPDLLPSMNLPYALVITTYPGATPEEVELKISKPLEQSMASLENVKNINSVSRESTSQLMLEFTDTANMDTIVPDIREKINAVAGSWDETVGTPYIMKINPDLLPVTVSAIERTGMSGTQLTEFVNDELLSKLEGISGVASVSLSGNVSEQISVTLSEKKLAALNEKIRKSLDGEFGEAEEEFQEKLEELKDGQSELSNKEEELAGAKSELQGGQSALVDQTTGMESELLDKKLELENTQTELKNKISEAQTNLSLLQGTVKILEEISGKYPETESALADIDRQIAGLTALRDSYGALAEQQAALLAQIEEISSGAVVPEGDLEAALAALYAEQETVEAAMAEAETAFADYGTSAELAQETLDLLALQRETTEVVLNQLQASLAEMNLSREDMEGAISELYTNIAALESGIAQMEQAIVQLADGSTTVSSALAELKRQQLQGSLQISAGLSQILVGESSLAAAKSQLESAEAQMDTAKDDMDAQKENAYKSAKIDVTMDMVNQILMAQNFSMPAGYITQDKTDYLVRVGDKISGLTELQNLVLFDTGIDEVGSVTLQEVADVTLTNNADAVYAKINGNDGLILSFSKQSTYATATVSQNIADKCKELTEKYEGLAFSTLSDQGDYIDIVIGTVLENLVLGAALAILILLFFLKDLRPTFIIACSIPISVLFAIVLMYFTGITLNVISLSGLAVGVGMLVDNSVVVIENIYRMRSEGESALKAAVKGTVQVTGAIIASTLTTVCVFLPIVFVEGLTRQIFSDLALTIAYSLLASLIVAITLVPAMASGMMKRNKVKTHRLFDKFLNGYEGIARVSLKHKWIVLLLSIVLLVGSAYLVLQKGFIFMPSMSGTQISVSITPPEEADFAASTALADEVYARVSKIEDLATIGVMLSGSDMGSMMSGGAGGGNGITMYAILDPAAKRKDAEISKEILAVCSDLEAEISAQGSMDMGSYMTSMGGAGVTVDIYGDKLDNLITEAEKMGEALAGIEGVEAVSTGIEDTSPELRIVVNKEKAMEKGLTVAQVYQMVAAKVKAETNSATAVDIENYDKEVVIFSEKNQGTSVASVKKMTLAVTDKEGKDQTIKLSAIAEIKETKSLNAINRVNQRRQISVSADIAEGYNVTKVTDTVRKALASYTPLEGNTVEIGGESDTIMDAVTQLAFMAILAVVIIYFIMVAQFQSLKSPFIVMFTIPLAFTGGFLALLVTGKDLSVVSIVGFIMLAGIIVNNGIVLIDYINILRLEGIPKREAIIQAGRTRMRPILMTALTTILGLVFMAVATGFGAELMQPMAIVCIGGLIYATLMTLFVVPAMYDLFSRREMRHLDLDD